MVVVVGRGEGGGEEGEGVWWWCFFCLSFSRSGVNV